MSVELLDTTRFYGYRARRQIDGKTYQDYFSLKKNGKRLKGVSKQKVKELAVARDEELKKQQDKAKQKRAIDNIFNDDGQVRGILYRTKYERSGTKTPVFKIGIMSNLEGKTVNTTVSINAHGWQGAWQRAVDFYCQHKKIAKRAKLYKSILAAIPKKPRSIK